VFLTGGGEGEFRFALALLATKYLDKEYTKKKYVNAVSKVFGFVSSKNVNGHQTHCR
jgi:hypothetical protein